MGGRGSVRAAFSSHRRAFTLFELVLVMVVITIALAIASPSLRNFAHGARMRDASAQFVSTCNWARTQAISTSKIHRVYIDPANATYRLLVQEGDEFINPGVRSVFDLPPGYRIEIARADREPGPWIDFHPTGRTDPARVQITANDGEIGVIESPSPAETFRVLTNPEASR